MGGFAAMPYAAHCLVREAFHAIAAVHHDAKDADVVTSRTLHIAVG
jgi:hypothetical protein